MFTAQDMKINSPASEQTLIPSDKDDSGHTMFCIFVKAESVIACFGLACFVLLLFVDTETVIHLQSLQLLSGHVCCLWQNLFGFAFAKVIA